MRELGTLEHRVVGIPVDARLYLLYQNLTDLPPEGIQERLRQSDWTLLLKVCLSRRESLLGAKRRPLMVRPEGGTRSLPVPAWFLYSLARGVKGPCPLLAAAKLVRQSFEDFLQELQVSMGSSAGQDEIERRRW